MTTTAQATDHPCCACYGEGQQRNPDEGEIEAFPHKEYDACYHCQTTGRCDCPEVDCENCGDTGKVVYFYQDWEFPQMREVTITCGCQLTDTEYAEQRESLTHLMHDCERFCYEDPEPEITAKAIEIKEASTDAPPEIEFPDDDLPW